MTKDTLPMNDKKDVMEKEAVREPGTPSSVTRSPTPVDENHKKAGEEMNDGLRDTSERVERQTGYLSPDPEKHTEINRLERSLTTSASTSQTAIDTRQAAVDIEAAAVAKPSSADLLNAEQNDPNIVWWDGEDDPENPLNWNSLQRWSTIAIVASITFVSPLASSMFAPGVPALMKEFHNTNTEVGALVVSIYVLGFAIGPLFLAPLSEMYGRLPLYHTCNVCFVLTTIGCAKSNSIAMLTIFRLLAGMSGSAPLTIGAGTIADLIPMQRRGRAMTIFVMGPLLGPIIGPVAGGFLAQAKGWRWVFWLLAIISAVITISCFIFMRETYALTILGRKAARLRKETGNPNLRSKLASPLAPRDLFKRSIFRPAVMLIFSPIILALSTFMAITYGYLYLLFTTFTIVFEGQYGFSPGTVGLSYLGLGVGSFVGLVGFGFMSDRLLRIMTERNGGVTKVEFRLPPMILGAPLIPIGFFWYGWSAEANVHWIVPIIGTGVIGCGTLSIFMPIQTYLVDAFTQYAASAMAANTVLRSVIGALLPLAGGKVYEKLGLGWGNSLLAFIALACCPIPIIFYKYGERLREKFDVSKY